MAASGEHDLVLPGSGDTEMMARTRSPLDQCALLTWGLRTYLSIKTSPPIWYRLQLSLDEYRPWFSLPPLQTLSDLIPVPWRQLWQQLFLLMRLFEEQVPVQILRLYAGPSLTALDC